MDTALSAQEKDSDGTSGASAEEDSVIDADGAPARWVGFCARRTNAQLWAGLRLLDAGEAQGLAVILAHLGELDARRAAAETARPSLFLYCTRELGYSEAEAVFRIRAARAARRFPSILTMIAERRIHVTAVAKIARHLTPENYRSLLAKAGRRTIEELDRLLASLAPIEEKRPVIRSLSVGSNDPPGPHHRSDLTLPIEPSAAGSAGLGLLAPASSGAEGSVLLGSALTMEPLQRIESERGSENYSGAPGSRSAEESNAQRRDRGYPGEEPAGRVLFHFVAGEPLRRKFKRAADLLRHKYPAGGPEHVFDDALEALLDRKDPDRRIARREKREQAKLGRRPSDSAVTPSPRSKGLDFPGPLASCAFPVNK